MVPWAPSSTLTVWGPDGAGMASSGADWSSVLVLGKVSLVMRSVPLGADGDIGSSPSAMASIGLLSSGGSRKLTRRLDGSDGLVVLASSDSISRFSEGGAVLSVVLRAGGASGSVLRSVTLMIL